MTDDQIKELAEKAGVDLGMYPPLRLTDMGDGTLRFVQPKRLTFYGAQLIQFARLVEAAIRSEG